MCDTRCNVSVKYTLYKISTHTHTHTQFVFTSYIDCCRTMENRSEVSGGGSLARHTFADSISTAAAHAPYLCIPAITYPYLPTHSRPARVQLKCFNETQTTCLLFLRLVLSYCWGHSAYACVYMLPLERGISLVTVYTYNSGYNRTSHALMSVYLAKYCNKYVYIHAAIFAY